jgi:hypothetical protein
MSLSLAICQHTVSLMEKWPNCMVALVWPLILRMRGLIVILVLALSWMMQTYVFHFFSIELLHANE